MNERIKQLANEAGAEVKIIHGDILYISKAELDIEKFAELIIKECMSIVDAQKESLCEDDSEWNDYEFGYHDAVIDANNMIKEYFGVEE